MVIKINEHQYCNTFNIKFSGTTIYNNLMFSMESILHLEFLHSLSQCKVSKKRTMCTKFRKLSSLVESLYYQILPLVLDTWKVGEKWAIKKMKVR